MYITQHAFRSCVIFGKGICCFLCSSTVFSKLNQLYMYIYKEREYDVFYYILVIKSTGRDVLSDLCSTHV